MSRPLLPTTRLIACPACAEHFKSDESRCPHCGAEPRGPDSRVAVAATAVLLGLALGGCPDKAAAPTDAGQPGGPAADNRPAAQPEPAYGSPVTPVPTNPEPEYGVPMTDDDARPVAPPPRTPPPAKKP